MEPTSPPPIADVHCHLAELPDPEAAVAEAVAAGVGPIVAVSMRPDDAELGLRLRERHPGRVRLGLGLHPSRVPELADHEIDDELRRLERRLPRADCVGEVGLDYVDAVTERDRRRQRALLERVLELAARHRLPVNLHTRRADRELLETAISFRRSTGLPALLHGFTHSVPLARRAAEAGLSISVGPSILTSPRQAEVARSLPEAALTVETDAPVEFGGVAARPSWAVRVVRELARPRDVDEGRLRETIAANVQRSLTGT